MQTKQIHILTLDSILDETQQFSELSLPLSFDLKDIQNQKAEQTHITDDFDDFFEQQDDTVSVSLTKKSNKSKSQTTKTVSRIDMLRQMSVMVKDQSFKNFVLKETVIDQKVFSKNVTFMNIANVSKPFEVTNKIVGLPTSIYATSSKFLAVGTSQSSVLLFEMGVKNYKLMETVNKNKYGSTTSIAICKENLFMVCGYQNGYLTIWDLSTFSLIKTIQSQMNNQTILKVQFVKGNEFISSDIQGNVILYSIEKYVWTSVKSKRLISQSPSSVYYDIKSLKLVNNKHIAALISYNSLVLISVVDPVEVIFKFERPQSVPSNSVPIGDIGLIKNGETEQNYVLISWGSKLFIYLYNPLSRTQPFQLKHTYQHSLSLISLQILSSTSFVLLDSTGIYKIFNLLSLISSLSSSIKSQGILKNDILIGKCSIHDTKYKNTANTVCKTIDNFNQIFFITQGGMFRCRFHKWTQMIYYLIESKEYLQALKCAIEIFNGRLDIFSQKVVISPRTMVLFNDMITYYLNIRLKEIKTLSAEEIKEIIITSIQYCVEIQSYEHLFTKIFSIISHHYHLEKEFIQSLQIFIRSHLIKRIPNFIVLEKIINYYTTEDSSVVDILILSLDPLSIDYYATLDVCVNHRLYSSLIYISQVNNDFVSPANKILEACQNIRDKGGNMKIVEEYTSLIYLQMIKLLDGKTIAGTPISQKSKELGITTLSLWFTIQENMKYLVNYNGVLYFEILQKLLDNQIVIESFRESKEENWQHKFLLDLKRLAAGYKQYQQALVNIILRINQTKDITKQLVEYCLKNLGDGFNKKSLQKFVDKNSTMIEELLKKDMNIGWGLPNQLKGIIYINSKNYQQALNIYQKLPNEQVDVLFTHMNDEFVKKYFQRLVDLNPDLTGQYIYENIYHEQVTSIVITLSPNTHAYLLIRRLMRQDKTAKILTFRKQTLLFYFQSLCKYKQQHRILYEISHQLYPKQYYIQSLALIKKYKFRECQANFIEPIEAYSIYKQVYMMRFASELHKLFYFKYSNANDYWRVNKSIFTMLKKVGNELEFFEFVLTQFNLPSKKKNFTTIGKQIEDIAEKKGMKDNNFINRIRDMVQHFLNICARTVQKQQFIQFIIQYREVFELKFMVSILTSTLIKLNLDITIYSTISQIIHDDDVNKFDRIIQFKGTTFYCKPICRSCGLFLTDGISSSILFECGHCFHIECILNYEVCQLCNENMFSRSSEIRRTMFLEESRFRNKSVFKQVEVNAVDSYAAFDKMLKKEREDDWSFPIVSNQ